MQSRLSVEILTRETLIEDVPRTRSRLLLAKWIALIAPLPDRGSGAFQAGMGSGFLHTARK